MAEHDDEDKATENAAPAEIRANVNILDTAAVHAKVDNLSRLLKVLGGGGLALLIAWLAFRYFQSENSIINAFIREQFIESLKSETVSKTELAISLRETANALNNQTKEQQLTRVELGMKLDNLAAAQRDLTKSIEQFVKLQTEQLKARSNEGTTEH